MLYSVDVLRILKEIHVGQMSFREPSLTLATDPEPSPLSLHHCLSKTSKRAKQGCNGYSDMFCY